MVESYEHSSAPRRDEVQQVIELVTREALTYLEGLDERHPRSQNVHQALSNFEGSLPETGSGAVQALTELIDKGIEATIATAGPRCFHFVIGGTTPAALGADWLTTTLDQMAYAWVATPLATKLELLSLDWLKELFGLPTSWLGVNTTGATMANFVCLATARQWLGEQQGIDVAEQGLTSLPSLNVFSSGIIHPSDLKALSMLGFGRSSVQMLTKNDVGEFDLLQLESALKALNGEPALIIAVAGEPNAGKFDPLAALADLAEEYNAWLHVDGAFGLFARASERTAHLLDGVERAHSVAADAHKWMNVPYDCGFAFVSDSSLLAKAFAHSAAYLPDPNDPEPVLGGLAPEMSRRARSLVVWATLRAYGRQGIRKMVEHNLALAEYLSQIVQDAPDLEQLADVPLNVVCFRYNPGNVPEAALNEINQQLGTAVIEDGRVFMGITNYQNKVALRPAFVNWRTRNEDIDLLVHVVRELGKTITAQVQS